VRRDAVRGDSERVREDLEEGTERHTEAEPRQHAVYRMLCAFSCFIIIILLLELSRLFSSLARAEEARIRIAAQL
jgi:hypothetical protein